jgi:hypothetical protein
MHILVSLDLARCRRFVTAFKNYLKAGIIYWMSQRSKESQKFRVALFCFVYRNRKNKLFLAAK